MQSKHTTVRKQEPTMPPPQVIVHRPPPSASVLIPTPAGLPDIELRLNAYQLGVLRDACDRALAVMAGDERWIRSEGRSH